MSRQKRIHVESPRTDGGSVFGFIAVLLVFLGALTLQAGDREPRMARGVFVEQQTDKKPNTSGQQQVGAEPRQTGQILVGSAQSEDIPVCNVDACSDAYRSFRPLDCTFQPYDGERRLCTR